MSKLARIVLRWITEWYGVLDGDQSELEDELRRAKERNRQLDIEHELLIKEIERLRKENAELKGHPPRG